MTDVPVRWGSWAPENHDGTFAGLVPLSRSLNIPFIVLLDGIGSEGFLGALR